MQFTLSNFATGKYLHLAFEDSIKLNFRVEKNVRIMIQN